MPYVSCPRCALRTYTPGTPYGRATCPTCGTELPRRVRVAQPSWGGRGQADEQVLQRVLDLARRELEMDVAFLGEIRDAEEVVRAVSGPEDFAMRPGDVLPLVETICGAVLAGRLDNAVPDTARDPACAGLREPVSAGVRAYVGVPLTMRDDAQLYMLCCLAGEARPALGASDVQFLQGLTASVRSALDGAA